MKKIYFLLAMAGIAFQGMAQEFVSTEVENRNVVLEEFTGIRCVYCPDGHRIAQEIKDENPDDVVLINIHAGFYAEPNSSSEPDFTTDGGDEINDYFKITSYPNGVVNRESSSGVSRNTWKGLAEDVLDEESPVNVAVRPTLDVETKTINVDVEVYYTDDAKGKTNRLSVGILQSNIAGPQTGGTTFYPENILPKNGDYNHQHMLRAQLTEDEMGDELEMGNDKGTFYSFNYVYEIPDEIEDVDMMMEFLEVYAFVSKDEEDIFTGVTEKVLLPDNMRADLEVEIATDLTALDLCTETVTPAMTITNDGPSEVNSFTVEVVYAGQSMEKDFEGTLGVGESTTLTWDEISLPGGSFTLGFVGPEDINDGDIFDQEMSNSMGEGNDWYVTNF